MARERGKCTLKKEVMEINRNNYETFFLLYLDGELNTGELTEVESFLREHADLQKEFSLLQHTIQRPVDTIFEPKELLYRREEKRRVIPIYWTRIAASLILILTGGLFTLSILKNHNTVITTKDQSVADVNTKKNHPDPDAAAKLIPEKGEVNTGKAPSQEMNALPDIRKNRDRSGQGTNKGLAEKTHPAQTTTASIDQNKKETGDRLKYSGEQDTPADDVMVIQKSGATPELQTSGNRNAEVAPGQLAGGTKTALLLMAVAGKNTQTGNENEQLTDIQTDNAISVIALNDRNKAITGFFKKLTKRSPANETAGYTKKLRVSVFQFSY
jgi:hypothetical protein